MRAHWLVKSGIGVRRSGLMARVSDDDIAPRVLRGVERLICLGHQLAE